MPFGIHPAFLIVLLIIVLIIFGPGKLPEMGGAIGRSIREFRKTSQEITDEVMNAVDKQSTPAGAPPAETTTKATETTTPSSEKPAPEKTYPEPETK